MSQSLTAEYLLALVAGWERKRGPRYLALAEAIQDAVHREELEDGTPAATGARPRPAGQDRPRHRGRGIRRAVRARRRRAPPGKWHPPHDRPAAQWVAHAARRAVRPRGAGRGRPHRPVLRRAMVRPERRRAQRGRERCDRGRSADPRVRATGPARAPLGDRRAPHQPRHADHRPAGHGHHGRTGRAAAADHGARAPRRSGRRRGAHVPGSDGAVLTRGSGRGRSPARSLGRAARRPGARAGRSGRSARLPRAHVLVSDGSDHVRAPAARDPLDCAPSTTSCSSTTRPPATSCSAAPRRRISFRSRPTASSPSARSARCSGAACAPAGCAPTRGWCSASAG